MKAPAHTVQARRAVLHDNTLVGFEFPSSPTSNPAVKRILDVVLSLAALIFAAPLFLAVAVWMVVFSPGPVLFKQERVGRNGRRFLCLKFRTMKVGASTTGHQAHLQNLIRTNAPMTKLDAQGDARLIPGAWLMRASGLDELPQIFNVLRGEMSLVGPRPCLPYEFEQYQPWQRARCEALPGLTGLWQISDRSRMTFEQMVRLDIRYTRTNTTWLDLSIMLRTVPVLIRQVIEIRRDRSATAQPTAAAA